MDLDGVAGEVGEVGCGYLGAAGIVDAEKEDGGFRGHGGCLIWVGGFAGCWKLGAVICALFPFYIQAGV